MQRVDDVRFSRFSSLILVRLACDTVRLLDHGNIIGRMIFLHMLNKNLIEFVRRHKFL